MFSDFRKDLLKNLEAALKKREDELKEMTGTNWGSPMGGDWFSGDNDPEDSDVPTPADDSPYYTQYVPKKESTELTEADEETSVKKVEKSEEETTVEEPPDTGAMPSDDMSDDMSADMGGGDMGMGGEEAGMMMPEEEEKDPEELGKTYELKKIYSRLVSIESYLATSSDINLLKLRNYVSKAIELFGVIIANVKSYKEKVDEIIVKYYEFLELVYILLSKYYKEKEEEDQEYLNGRAK